jgi:hypothetical protein
MNILWKGARGEAVKKLQTKLKQAGYDPGTADGVYGATTMNAVKACQKDKGLRTDGIAGPQLMSALNLSSASTGRKTRGSVRGIADDPAPPKEEGATRRKVFISYSHMDGKWLKRLQVHLAPLERSGFVERWDDSKIDAGQMWRDEIEKAMESARVAVLLVSADFMASSFIANDELPPLLSAANQGGATILSVIVSPCIMGKLSEFQAVNSPSKTLIEMDRGDRERVWIKLVEAITTALNK